MIPEPILYGLIVVLILLVVWMYLRSNPSAIIVAFLRPTCPACKVLKPEWNLFKSQTGWDIRTVEVDCDDPSTTEIRANFGVTSVPSIWKLCSDGRRYQYPKDSPRTAESIMKFAQEKSVTVIGEK